MTEPNIRALETQRRSLLEELDQRTALHATEALLDWLAARVALTDEPDRALARQLMRASPDIVVTLRYVTDGVGNADRTRPVRIEASTQGDDPDEPRRLIAEATMHAPDAG